MEGAEIAAAVDKPGVGIYVAAPGKRSSMDDRFAGGFVVPRSLQCD
jgi:hypothetical protein